MILRNGVVAFASTLILAAEAFAGIPYEETLTCPVGGQEFDVTSTMSCSTMGRTLSLRPISSCDFITRLPVCPSNRLPIFDEFNEDDVAKLEVYIDTPEYRDLIKAPKYLRAATIARHLNRSSDRIMRIMGQGLMFDRKESLKYSDYLSIYEKNLELVLPDLDEGERPYLLLGLAFEHHLAGNETAASETLERVTTDITDANDYLRKYRNQVSDCISGAAKKDACLPTTRIG